MPVPNGRASPPALGIGPLNTAGQAVAWTNAVNSRLGVPALSFASAGPISRRRKGENFKDAPHVSMPHPRLAPTWYRAWRLRQALGSSTRVIAESFMDLPGREAHAFVAHGSDVRDPDVHMARLEHSYFREAEPRWVDHFRTTTAENRIRARQLPTFVSTPDLLLDIPEATWLPLATDVKSWRTNRPVLQRDVPVVLHMPSKRRPPIKGTEHIDRFLSELHDAGRIEYVSPLAVSHAEVRNLVWQSDVVVDQIMTGSYGVAAVEALAAGRLVIGNVHADVRQLMIEAPPIVDASPRSLRDVMDQVLEERQRFSALAGEGPPYASRWHGGDESASVLGGFLGLPATGGPALH